MAQQSNVLTGIINLTRPQSWCVFIINCLKNSAGYLINSAGYLINCAGYLINCAGYLIYCSGYLIYCAGYLINCAGYLSNCVGYLIYWNCRTGGPEVQEFFCTVVTLICRYIIKKYIKKLNLKRYYQEYLYLNLIARKVVFRICEKLIIK